MHVPIWPVLDLQVIGRMFLPNGETDSKKKNKKKQKKKNMNS